MSKAVSIYNVFFLMENEAWDFDANQPKLYGLKYYNKDGELRTRYNVRKHVGNVHELKQRQEKQIETSHSSRGQYDRAIKGLFPIWDTDTEEYRSIMAAQIVYFRNHGSKEWRPIKN